MTPSQSISQIEITKDHDFETEDEDEEVKMSCAGGRRSVQNFDFNAGNSSMEDEKESAGPSDERYGVVNFVKEHMQQPAAGVPLHRPKAVLPGPVMPSSLLSDVTCETNSSSTESIRHSLETTSASSLLSGTSQIPDVVAFRPIHEKKCENIISPFPQNIELSVEAEQSLKRVHSWSNLESLDNVYSPKRMRWTFDYDPLSFLPASSESQSCFKRVGVASPVSPFEDDGLDDELDKRLSEELDQDTSETISRKNSLVPLLTPPQSPLTIQAEEGSVHVCEWPSNLAVDAAMSAVLDLRSMSPNSLQKFEREEEERIGAHNRSRITPLLRGIPVGFS